jgi:hypothetical protein
MAPRQRRGIALMDAILGGVILAIGLAVVLSLASRSMAAQVEGARQIAAAWLLDDLLSMVLVEGPMDYPKLYSTHGRFEEPFSEYEYDLDIEDIGLRKPYRVTATVRWPSGRTMRQVQAQTYIAVRDDDPLEKRAPDMPIDRIGRYYDEQEE